MDGGTMMTPRVTLPTCRTGSLWGGGTRRGWTGHYVVYACLGDAWSYVH